MFEPHLIDQLFEEATGRRLVGDGLYAKINEYVQFARAGDKNVQQRLMKFPLPDEFPGAAAYNGADFPYLSGGAYNAHTVAQTITRHHQREHYRILDFGAGMGRLLRFFNLFAPNNEYAAWEVNPDSVGYLSSAFPDSNDVRVIPAKPPVGFKCERFDAIYAWSIWSHFSEELARNWLECLLEFLNPGGLLLFTVHNDEIVRRYGSDEKLVQRMKEKRGDYPQIVRDYEQSGFAFWRWYPEKAEKYGIDIDTFGMAFISRNYIYDNWSDLFEILEIVDNVAPGWQDLLVCKKR